MRLVAIILLYCYITIFIKPAFAQNKILINEFLIDPQPQYVEIFNSGTESADLSDWIIDDSGGTTFYTIPKNNIIFPNQCLIFSADFNLNKTSADTVRLINNEQKLIDSFSYKLSSGSGITYHRFPDNSNYWTTGSATLGFYNQTNISCLVTPTLTPTLTITPTITPIPTEQITLSPIETQTPVPAPQSYDNIYISEAMVNPTTGEKEWLEIYNNNDFPVFLSNWHIDDLENGGSSPKIFSLEIGGKSYVVFNLTSFMFNNNGDSVRLLDFNKNLKDSFEYQSSTQGKSLGRISFDSDNFCLQEPSKNSVNNSCINPTPIIITSIATEQISLPPTINTIVTKTPIYSLSRINPTPKKQVYSYAISLTPYAFSSNVLGLTTKISHNNFLLINLLSIISISYSLLTIISILFKMKLSYGKNKNFYSSSPRSS